MTAKRTPVSAAVPALAAMLLLLATGPALAALDEKPVIDDINDTVAVIHGLELRKLTIEENREIVHASYDLTERQHKAQKHLYESELARAKTSDEKEHKEAAELASKRAEMFKARLDRLERQMNKLKEFDFDAIYDRRIKELDEQITLARLDLDARTTEFETLFGKKPHVDLEFLQELREKRGTRKDLEHYLKLD